MDYHIEPDSVGRPVVHGTSEKGKYVLNVAFVMYGHTDGRAYITNDSGGAPTNLSPPEAQLLRWYEKNNPRAEGQVFAGEPAVDG